MSEEINLTQFEDIEKDSPLHKDILYLLELHLGTFEFKTNKVVNVQRKNLTNRYKTYVEDSQYVNKTTCVFLTDKLDEQNPLNEVLDRGFAISQNSGLLCYCGYVPLRLEKGRVYTALVAEVAIRKSKGLASSELSLGLLSDLEFKNEFDSIYITNRDLESGKRHPFECDMIVFNNSQVLPMYFVEFEFKKNLRGLCQSCLQNRAEVHCIDENLDLCSKCDASIHMLVPEGEEEHKRVPYDEKPISLSYCKEHPKELLQLICTECQKQICIECKLKGDHSEGPMANHEIVSFNDCYNFLKQNFHMRSMQTINLTKILKGHIKSLNIKIKKMKQDFNRLESDLDGIFDRLKKSLQALMSQNLYPLESASIMLQNRLKKLRWMEYFIKFQMDYENPEEYVKKVFSHQRIQHMVYNNMTIPNGKQFTAKHSKFRVEGNIEIVDIKDIIQKQKNKKSRDRMIKKMRERQKFKQETEKQIQAEIFMELGAKRLQEQGMETAAEQFRRNQQLYNGGDDGRKITLTQKRIQAAAAVPKLKIPTSESTRLGMSTTGRGDMTISVSRVGASGVDSKPASAHPKNGMSPRLELGEVGSEGGSGDEEQGIIEGEKAENVKSLSERRATPGTLDPIPDANSAEKTSNESRPRSQQSLLGSPRSPQHEKSRTNSSPKALQRMVSIDERRAPKVEKLNLKVIPENSPEKTLSISLQNSQMPEIAEEKSQESSSQKTDYKLSNTILGSSFISSDRKDHKTGGQESERSMKTVSFRAPSHSINLTESSEMELPSTARGKFSLSYVMNSKLEALMKLFGQKEIENAVSQSFEQSIIGERDKLYLYLNCLDISELQDSSNFPTTDEILLYQQEQGDSDQPNGEDMLQAFKRAGMQPIIVILRANGTIFGGYCEGGWDEKENKAEGVANFLFSLKDGTRLNLRKDLEGKMGVVYHWQNENEFGWGTTDLVCREDGYWNSQVGETYDCDRNLPEESSRKFFAGAYEFEPDAIEIWKLEY